MNLRLCLQYTPHTKPDRLSNHAGDNNTPWLFA